MKKSNEISQFPTPLLELEISQDNRSGNIIRRLLEVEGLSFNNDCVRLKYKIWKLNIDTGDKLIGQDYQPTQGFLEAFCDERGPFINPENNNRVFPSLLPIPGEDDPMFNSEGYDGPTWMQMYEEQQMHGPVFYPDNTITRYAAIMYLFGTVVPYSNLAQMQQFIQAADTNGEFNV